MKKIIIYSVAFIFSFFAPLVLAFDDGRGRYPSDPKPAPVTEKLPPKYKFPEKRPTAKTVANILKKGGALALSQAVVDILGHGVDWVLDPENNRVKYNVDKSNLICDVNNRKIPISNVNNYHCSVLNGQGALGLENIGGNLYKSFCSNTYTVVSCSAQGEQSIELEKVAEQVIKNAEKGDKSSIDVANEAVEKENPNPDENESKNKDNSKEKLDFPDFCDWARPVCDFINWVKKEPELKDDEVPTKNIELKNPSEFDRDYVNVQAQCPADVVRDIPIGPNTFKLTFEMSPICDFASTYMRPVLIFMSYILGALMIGNAVRVD